MEAAMTTVDLTRELEREDVEYELIQHRRTATAAEEASALGVPAAEVAKTIVLVSEAGFVRAVIPASERLDLAKVRARLRHPKHLRLATEAELEAAYPMYEVGALPPVGGPGHDRTIVDRRLALLDAVEFDAGCHYESVRLRTRDVLLLAEAEIADICEDAGTG
jgi:Ala-tRNA(Pro) deacylase